MSVWSGNLTACSSPSWRHLVKYTNSVIVSIDFRDHFHGQLLNLSHFAAVPSHKRTYKSDGMYGIGNVTACFFGLDVN